MKHCSLSLRVSNSFITSLQPRGGLKDIEENSSLVGVALCIFFLSFLIRLDLVCGFDEKLLYAIRIVW